jgi:hypothetical protein
MSGAEQGGPRPPTLASSLREGMAAGDDEAARRAGGNYERHSGW